MHQYVEDMDIVNLPMDDFSVRARAAVELGQQSENALSYLDRKTEVNQQVTRGVALPRDQAKTGAICQIVVRDTGFNMGVALWCSVGLLVSGVSGNKRGWFTTPQAAQISLKKCGTTTVWY